LDSRRNILIEFTDKVLVFITSMQCSNNTLSVSFIPGALIKEEEEEEEEIIALRH